MRLMEETLRLYELTSMVRATIEQTFTDEYWLEAELSEARVAQNGHFYGEFIEKDARGVNIIARARVTAWARTYNILSPLFGRATGEHLRAGLKIRACVTVEFHEQYGFSLNIIDIDPSYTLGDMARRRREILTQLEADGILEDNKNLELPALMKRIAVVSSAGAAGYGDFCDQLVNNAFGLAFEVRLFPAVMQGTNVEASVLAALEAICDEPERWDCVVIIRGGGATSDLSDFDSYSLAAAVAQMPLPVVVGIGHERDETVLDFVAHTRVKTPTAAAAFLIDHGTEQLALLDELQQRIVRSTQLAVQSSLFKVQGVEPRITRAAQLVIQGSMLKVQSIEPRFARAVRHILESSKLRAQSLEARVAALDPELQLRRGYSLTYTDDGRLVRSVADVHEGDTIKTRIADGDLLSVLKSADLFGKQ